MSTGNTDEGEMFLQHMIYEAVVVLKTRLQLGKEAGAYLG